MLVSCSRWDMRVRTHAHIVFAHCITLSCGHTLDFLPHQWNVQVFRDYTRIEWQIHDDAARDIFFFNKVFPTPPRATIWTRLGARGKPNFCTMTCMSFVRNIRLLTCRWARPMLARELMRVWQQTAEGHVPWLQRRVRALRAATRAERTGLHRRRRTDLQPQGPDPERERGRHRGMCVVPSSCKRGGLLQWFAVFTANTATPSFRVTPPNLVGPLQPPPCSRKTPKSLIIRAHTHRVLPADSVCCSSFWRISGKPSGAETRVGGEVWYSRDDPALWAPVGQ